ncbi:hypothetical protein, partial [Serratia marcescens]
MSECVPPCWCRKAIPLRKARRCSKIRKTPGFSSRLPPAAA